MLSLTNLAKSPLHSSFNAPKPAIIAPSAVIRTTKDCIPAIAPEQCVPTTPIISNAPDIAKSIIDNAVAVWIDGSTLRTSIMPRIIASSATTAPIIAKVFILFLDT